MRGLCAETVQTVHLIVPGDPETLTGGYLYDRRIAEELPTHGTAVVVHALVGDFPRPDDAARAHAAATFASVPDDALVVVDGLALGALPDIARAHDARLRLVALVHHPLSLETGLPPNEATRLQQTERAALALVRRVIVTSPTTARALDTYGVPAEGIGIVPPGTDPAPLHAGSPDDATALLCVATLVPRKGHLVLLDALTPLAPLNWSLTCVGGAQHDPDHAARLRAVTASSNLTERVNFVGEVRPDALASYYDRADVFVLASHYEGYGMALAEALACGLPVISTTGGAIADTVPREAGILVAPGDVPALRQALATVIEDRAARARLTAGAARARQTLPSWADAVARFAAELAKIS